MLHLEYFFISCIPTWKEKLERVHKKHSQIISVPQPLIAIHPLFFFINPINIDRQTNQGGNTTSSAEIIIINIFLSLFSKKNLLQDTVQSNLEIIGGCWSVSIRWK